MTSLSSRGEASDIPVPAYQRGFQTLENETSVAVLDVEGRIPGWLTGTLLRIGPGRFEWGPDRYRHWFEPVAREAVRRADRTPTGGRSRAGWRPGRSAPV